MIKHTKENELYYWRTIRKPSVVFFIGELLHSDIYNRQCCVLYKEVTDILFNFSHLPLFCNIVIYEFLLPALITGDMLVPVKAMHVCSY